MQTSLCFRPSARRFFVTTILLGGAALFITSVLAIIGNLVLIRSTGSNPAANVPHEYSFIDEDYPMYYPLDIHDALLISEDTVHYGITGPDADEEWKSVYPPGGGFVCLGPNMRKFGFALYHEMHCLDRIRQSIGKNNYNHHIHHCINYLRQTILCEADTTIEPVEEILGSKVVRTRVKRMCKDWTQVYDEGEKEACGRAK